YAVIPYAGGVNGRPQMYGYANEAAQITDVASHEIAEAVTDPLLNAWFDNTRGEIGDITVQFHQYLNGYYVQLPSNKADQALLVSNGPYYVTTPTGVVTIGARGAPTAASMGSFSVSFFPVAPLPVPGLAPTKAPAA